MTMPESEPGVYGKPQEPPAVALESPEADAVDQQRFLVEEPNSVPPPTDHEADAADVIEQAQPLDYDEDEYR